MSLQCTGIISSEHTRTSTRYEIGWYLITFRAQFNICLTFYFGAFTKKLFIVKPVFIAFIIKLITTLSLKN